VGIGVDKDRVTGRGVSEFIQVMYTKHLPVDTSYDFATVLNLIF